MGKWIERLQSQTAHPLAGATDETPETPLVGVLSVMAVAPQGGCANSSPADSGPDLSAVAWTDEDIARFLARRAGLLRWGWSEPEAENLAARLHERDLHADYRQLCVECQHYRRGRCGNHGAAGLATNIVGRELATMFQNCGSFKEN